MAMGGFNREELDAPLAEINVTPFVDVMLVLLVIFLVTAPMLTHSIKLELPHDAATVVKDQKASTLSIDASGTYYWNDTALDEPALEAQLQQAAQADAAQPLHIRADGAVAYQKVSHALALAAKHGLTN
ncbi:MAG: biopolymer transporter ExbD, partial [Alphaproteobacteria bacterium]|nr:biopolymer transporter ExbD [Alphaproteobacteria bacterium]